MFMGQLLKLRCIKPYDEFAFLVMIWMWSDHVSLLFNVMPKYLACCTSLICEFRINY